MTDTLSSLIGIKDVITLSVRLNRWRSVRTARIIASATNLRCRHQAAPAIGRDGTGAGEATMDIKHVVVLMLENRSFDCMLGMLRAATQSSMA